MAGPFVSPRRAWGAVDFGDDDRSILAIFDSEDAAVHAMVGNRVEEATVAVINSATKLVPFVERAEEAGATDVWSRPQCEPDQMEFLQREKTGPFLERLKRQASQERAAESN